MYITDTSNGYCVDCGLSLHEGEFMRCSMCEQLEQEQLQADGGEEDEVVILGGNYEV